MYKQIEKALDGFDTRKTLGQDCLVFVNEINLINFQRFKIIGMLSTSIFFILYLLDLYYLTMGKWEVSPGYKILFYSHGTVLLLLITGLLLAWANPVEQASEITGFHILLVQFVLFLGLANMAVITIGDVLINGSIAAFLGSIFAFAAIFIMPHVFSLLLYLFCMVFMLALLVKTGEYTNQSITIQMINTVTFSCIALVLSRVLFFYQLRDFKNRRLIKQQRERLEELAMRDHLTHALNRRSFLGISKLEMERAARHDRLLSLSILDLDYFKNINDTHGHHVGDRVLVELAQLVRQNIRKMDLFVRWGGEEFIIMAPETDLASMVQLAEKLRNLIQAHQSPHTPAITASFGVTEFAFGESIDSLVIRADKALYRAKARGRNRVEVIAAPCIDDDRPNNLAHTGILNPHARVVDEHP
jgi:diguanylate cyclase (GGDEF)-like protein